MAGIFLYFEVGYCGHERVLMVQLQNILQRKILNMALCYQVSLELKVQFMQLNSQVFKSAGILPLPSTVAASINAGPLLIKPLRADWKSLIHFPSKQLCQMQLIKAKAIL